MRSDRKLGTAAATGLVIAAGIAGCGGGGSHGTPVAPPAPGLPGASPLAGATRAPQTATLTIQVPNQVAVASRARKPKFVSSGTVAITVAAAPTGTPTAQETLLTKADISSSSASCTAVSAYGRACTISVPIPASFVSSNGTSPVLYLDVATYTAMASTLTIPTGGSISVANANAGTLLGEGILNNVVVQQNSANATLPPVVISGNVATIVARTTGGNSITIPATNASSAPTTYPFVVGVTAKDAANNTIIGQYLTPITATLVQPNSGVGLQITNASSVGTPAPTATPTLGAPGPAATTLANSGDQLTLLATGKGVLYDTLALTAGTASAPTPIPIAPADPTIYEDYDTYFGAGGQTLNLGSSVYPTALTSMGGSTNSLAFAWQNAASGATSYGVGLITFSSLLGPQASICTLGAATTPIVAMSTPIGNTVYVADSGAQPAIYGVDTTAVTGGACSATRSSVPTNLSGDASPVTSLAVAYDGTSPEVWIATQSYLYAYQTSTFGFRTFPAGGSNNFLYVGGVVSNLQPFGSPINSLNFGDTATPVPFVAQGILFGDTQYGQLNVVATQPDVTPAPTSPAATATPALYREGLASPIATPYHFTNGTVAFTYRDTSTLYRFAFADNSGSIYTQYPATPITDNSGTGSNWASPQPATFSVSNAYFGPQAIVSGAENGTVLYGVGIGYSGFNRGLIRYPISGYSGTPLPNFPNSLYSSSATQAGAALGGDGRIWVADSANLILYAWPGYALGQGIASRASISESAARRPYRKTTAPGSRRP